MKTCLIALLLAQGAGLALAQPGANATASGSASASTQAASFRCGGVGDEDQKKMKAEASQHDVMLTFATSGGAYLADIDVQISSGGKTVLQGRCGGPLMLVDLAPQGSYEIRAVSNGREQRKTLAVGGKKPASLAFTWPAS